MVMPNATVIQRARPLADDFLANSLVDTLPRFALLTHLTLTNLRCISPAAPSAFLAAHTMLEVLHLDVVIQSGGNGNGIANGNGNGSSPLKLPAGSLPHLREIKASRDVINAILQCPPLPGEARPRPLEIIKGFKLSGHIPAQSNSNALSMGPDAAFMHNLKHTGAGAGIRRVELLGWHDIDEVKRLVGCLPGVQYLDVGRRIGASGERNGGSGGVVERNMLEWTDLMATLPDLVSMHGVRFFYEVSSVAGSGPGAGGVSGSGMTTSNTGAGGNTGTGGGGGGQAAHAHVYHIHDTADSTSNSPSTHGNPITLVSIPPLPHISPNISMMERSRLRKNDEIASLLAWKCRKLRRVDHWETAPGAGAGGDRKVVVLVRDGNTAGDGEGVKERESKVRWEVRKVKV